MPLELVDTSKVIIYYDKRTRTRRRKKRIRGFHLRTQKKVLQISEQVYIDACVCLGAGRKKQSTANEVNKATMKWINDNRMILLRVITGTTLRFGRRELKSKQPPNTVIIVPVLKFYIKGHPLGF